jgi:hypothetical protein
VLLALAPAFPQPTSRRFVTLLAAALLTPGRRPVANLRRTLGPLAGGHVSSAQRVFSAASRSGLQLACLRTRLVVRPLLPQGVLLLAGADTVDGHQGKHVSGKARPRDPVRSTHSHPVWRYGHKGVVLAVLVRFPFARRPGAPPLLVDRYRSPEDNRRRNRPHRTPAQLMCRLRRRLLLWLPGRQSVFVGDAGSGSHAVARFGRRPRARLPLISKLSPEANLYQPPPPYRGRPWPRGQGARLPKPHEAVAAARPRRLTVGWYGGGQRRVEVVSGSGPRYKSGRGLVALRGVHVRDRTGAHRDESLDSTDRRACSGCTRWWPCGTRRCRRPSGRAGSMGRGRQRRRSPTR